MSKIKKYLDKVCAYKFMEKFFSVKNSKDKKHKIVMLLGITFKCKRNTNFIFLIKNNTREKVKKIKGLTIIFRGENAVVEIGADPLPRFINAKIELGCNSFVSIGSSSFKQSFRICNLAVNGKILIDNDFSSEDTYMTNRDEPNTVIKIGKNCMFSGGIYIRTADGHTIVNEKGEVVNKPVSGIYIGNHVWLCNGARILKDSLVPDNSIVANSAIVTKAFTEKNVILAGMPAKIVKKQINWYRRPIHTYEDDLRRK